MALLVQLRPDGISLYLENIIFFYPLYNIFPNQKKNYAFKGKWIKLVNVP